MANFSNFYRNVRRNSRPQRKNAQTTETLGNRIMRSSGVGASVNPLTPTQKAEQERAQRMRQGISPASYVVRSQVGRNITNAPRINKAVVTNNRLFGSLRGNALAPIKQTADYTRSQQSKYLNTDIQRKGMYTPATQLMAGKTNIGVEQGKTLRAGMMTNSPLIESWRQTSSAAEKAYRDRYGFNKEYQEALKRRLDNSSINEDVDARGTNRYDPHGDYAELSVPLPSGRAMPTAMTVQNGAGVYHVGDSIRDIKADDFRSGLADTLSSKNPEDVYRRQTGKELDEDTLQRLEQQRGTWGYNAGMMTGQMAQYGLTRGALSALGIVGKAAQAERAAKAAGNLNKARAISFGSELGIDQAASLPLNILDAFKENSPQEIWNRFKMNQGLDALFSIFTTGFSIANNPAFKEAKALHESANELRASGDKAMADATDMAAYKKMGEVPKEEIDLAQEEIRNAGYHAGDLGKAENYFQQASSNRGTGHYGTGTYFGGKEDMFNGSSGYGNRPEWEVDFDGYNLYNPDGYEQGIRVHDSLATVDRRGAKGLLKDYYLKDTKPYIEKVLERAQTDVTPNNIQEKISAVKGTAEDLLPEYRIDEIEQSAKTAYEEELARVTDEDYIQNRAEQYRRDMRMLFPEDEVDDAMILDLINSEEAPTLPSLDEFRLNYYVSELRNELDGNVQFGRSSLAENAQNAQTAVKQLAKDLGKTEAEVLDAIKKSADKVEKEYPSISQASGRKDLDSEATLVMKNLGFEGVDVRGIDGLDNTEYGSVIYDLKPESRRQQIREGKPSEPIAEEPKQLYNEPRGESNGAEKHQSAVERAGSGEEEVRANVGAVQNGERQAVGGTHLENSPNPASTGRTGSTLSLTDEQRAVMDAAGKTNANLREADYSAFSNALNEGKASNKYGSYVDPQSVDELTKKGAKTFLSDDGSVGFAITKDGDMIGAFNRGGKYRGAVDDMLITARLNGGTKLDCYGIGLVNKYEQAGYIPVARIPFNPEYVNDPLLLANKPDVYVMMKNGDDIDTVIRKNANGEYHLSTQSELDDLYTVDDYGEALSFRDKLLDGQESNLKNPKYDRSKFGETGYEDSTYEQIRQSLIYHTSQDHWSSYNKQQIANAETELVLRGYKDIDSIYNFSRDKFVEAGYPRETKTAPKKTTKNNTAETTEKQTAKPVKQTEQAQDKTWQEHAREDYKTGKQRAKAVEEGKIPSRENGEVVNAIKRLKETKDFSNVKDALNRGVKDGIYNRKIRHLDEEIDKAIKEIEADPEKAINDVLDYHPNGAKANDVPADAIPWVMKGYALCKWADANGMTALKEDIAATMAKAQSTGGSILRAGQVFTVMADTKTQRDIVAEYVEKMQEKYASRLGDHKLTVSEDLLNKLDNATTDAEKSKILDDITVHVWNQVPQSFIEALGSFRIVSMLANTTTMIRNLASNAGFLGVREVDKSVNTMMEATAEKLNKIDRAHRTHTIYNPFSRENRKIQAYWYSDYGKHRNIIKGQSRWDEGGGTLSLDLRPQEGRHFGIKAGGGRKGGLIGVASAGLEGTRKATSWIMDTGDEAFLAPAYADAATQLMVVRGWKVEDLTPARVQEIRDYATLVAQQATYRDPSEFATALAKWGHWQKGDGALRLVRAVGVSGLQPFKKTPINVGKRAVEYSPIGFVKGVYDIRSAIKAGDSTAVNKAITELSKGTTGTGLVVAGYLLAEQGVINAQLPTDDEGYLRRDLGEQDYALNIGGKSRSLQWAAPGAIPFLSGATLYDQVQQRGWNALLKPQTLVSVLSKSANPLLEMSFMQSYMDIAESTDDVKSVDKFFVGMEQIGLSYAAQYVPTMLGKIANLVDPVRRDTSSQSTDPYVKAYERFINKSVINKIPFKSKSLPAYRDAFGNIQTTEDVKDRIIQNFVSPWYTKEIKSDDPVFKELFRINNATPDTNLIPTNSIGKGKHELSLNGEKINLDPHDMEEYKRIRGEGNQKALEFIGSDGYKSMSDTEKAKALEDIYENAKVDAKRQMLLKKGKSEWDVYTEGFEGAKADQIGAAKNAGIDPKDYNHTLTDKTADADGNGTVSKSEYYDYLLRQNQYNDKQRAVLMAAKNKSWDGKYNPFVTGEPPKDSQAAHAESTSYTDDIKSTGLSEKQFKEITSADTARIDSNGSGRVSQKEYQAYLDSFSYLTDEQKSALWKKYNPHWKKNPYDGSTASSGRSKRGRSGRRSSGGSSSKTKKREKTASEKRFAALQTGKAPTNAKGIEALSNGAKGLTKAQKKALVKLMQKKLDV